VQNSRYSAPRQSRFPLSRNRLDSDLAESANGGSQRCDAAPRQDPKAPAIEHLLSFGNDVGLFAEEIDFQSGEALGNFPQAFTHVGLINVALAIDKARNGTGKGVRAA
jgi:GH15 family glucan-1,4-alpha-glucosidase